MSAANPGDRACLDPHHSLRSWWGLDFPTMPDPNPRNLRNVRDINRTAIMFSAARVPNTSRLLIASSENKVVELDASQASPTARDLADHGRYVTCVRLSGNIAISGAYDNRLIWWDL